jgi:hypothetical protein
MVAQPMQLSDSRVVRDMSSGATGIECASMSEIVFFGTTLHLFK